MNYRVYVLLDTVEGSGHEAIEVLRESPGIVMTDELEGSPDVLILVEAPEREQLAKWTIEALNSVEKWTEKIQLLPTKDSSNRIVTKSRP